jgi:hypothetical protein
VSCIRRRGTSCTWRRLIFLTKSIVDGDWDVRTVVDWNVTRCLFSGLGNFLVVCPLAIIKKPFSS